MRRTLTLTVGLCALLLGCTAEDVQVLSTEIMRQAGVDEQKATRLGLAVRKGYEATMPISIKEEVDIGQGVALQAFQRFGPLYNDPQLQHYVNLVGNVIAQTCDRPELAYHFAVIDNDAINAFAGPGGYIFVTKGLLRQLHNEAELAGVLAHEIAHVTQKHALKTIRRAKLLEAGYTALLDEEKQKKFAALSDFITRKLFDEGFDRNFEYEADRYGTEFAARAGYNPYGLRNFIMTLAKLEGSRTGGWFKTHPDPADRIARLNAFLRQNYPSSKGYAVLEARYRQNVLSRLR